MKTFNITIKDRVVFSELNEEEKEKTLDMINKVLGFGLMQGNIEDVKVVENL